MKNNFKKEIEDNFYYLFEIYNFKIVREKYNKDLSDFVILAQGNELRLRFIKDRNDFFLDISFIREPEIWFNFFDILEWLRCEFKLNIEYKPINKIKFVSKLLKKYYKIIEDNFSEKNIKQLKRSKSKHFTK